MRPVAKAFLLLFLAAILNVGLPATAVAQCSACKASVETHLEGEEGSTGLGLNSGILYLLGMPYLAAMCVGAAWFYNYRKNRKLQFSQ